MNRANKNAAPQVQAQSKVRVQLANDLIDFPCSDTSLDYYAAQGMTFSSGRLLWNTRVRDTSSSVPAREGA